MEKKTVFSLCVMVILVIIMCGCGGRAGNSGGLGDIYPRSWTLTIINKANTFVELKCPAEVEGPSEYLGIVYPGADRTFEVPDQAVLVLCYGDLTEGVYGKWSQTGNERSEPIDRSRVVVAKGTRPENYVNTIKNIVLVQAGTFQMGDTRFDNEAGAGEKPSHTVTLTYDYYIGQYEVTFDEYDTYCEATGKNKLCNWLPERGSRPVTTINWYDAINYCNWLSEQAGLQPAYDGIGNLLDTNGQETNDITEVEGYRLPTDAEWEYAARGGQKDITDGVEANDYKYSGSNNADEVAWQASNSNLSRHEAGQKEPNELKLYDMSGNVWEWCHDKFGTYSGSARTNPIGADINFGFTPIPSRVIRGGSWVNTTDDCRVSTRFSYPSYSDGSSYYSKYMGFRIALIARIQK